ncbi:CDP-glycerol glycerophosphotransferase family protein, partial [Staphylococcus pasteuri]
WKEFDDIIAKHGGTTPANRDNVPGVVADDEHELVALVQKAINTNYHLPEKVRHNYRQINEFNDNRNTERVIQELKNDKVL